MMIYVLTTFRGKDLGWVCVCEIKDTEHTFECYSKGSENVLNEKFHLKVSFEKSLFSPHCDYPMLCDVWRKKTNLHIAIRNS